MPRYSASDLLALRQEDRPFQIKMVERIPIKSPIKRYTHMFSSPTSGKIDGAMAHISEETGFYMVGRQESVIFYSKGPGEQKNCLLVHLLIEKTLDDSGIVVELAVIRGIGDISPMTDKFYSWLTEVVDTACSLRRDIQVKSLPSISDNLKLTVLLANSYRPYDSGWY